MSDFFVPDHVEDIPPPRAAAVEKARAAALAWLADNDYQLIIPPLVEYLQTLTAGDETLDLQTFKITDTLSGRTLGVRADQTPQIVRYDGGVGAGGCRRYCYCGPTLRAHPPLPWQSRENMQLGAELFGAPAPAGDWEIIRVALGCLQAMGAGAPRVDLGHAGLFSRLTAGVSAENKKKLVFCLSRRDVAGVTRLTRENELGDSAAAALVTLAQTHGEPAAALATARAKLPAEQHLLLDEVAYVVRQLQGEAFDVAVNFSDSGSYGYHTGIVFAVHVGDSLMLRGGRYAQNSGVAAGFSADLFFAAAATAAAARPPVAVPMTGDDPSWRRAVAALRAAGRRIRFVYDEPASPPLLERRGDDWRVTET